MIQPGQEGTEPLGRLHLQRLGVLIHLSDSRVGAAVQLLMTPLGELHVACPRLGDGDARGPASSSRLAPIIPPPSPPCLRVRPNPTDPSGNAAKGRASPPNLPSLTQTARACSCRRHLLCGAMATEALLRVRGRMMVAGAPLQSSSPLLEITQHAAGKAHRRPAPRPARPSRRPPPSA